MKSIVLNSSSGVFIAKLGLFKELLKFTEFITTEEVKEETQEGVERDYRDAFIRMDLIDENKIKIIKPKDVQNIIKKYKLDETDASVLVLAEEKNLPLATEDIQLRKIAQSLDVKIIDTAAFIYLLYKKGKLETKRALMLLDLLDHFGYKKETIVFIKEKILLEA